jgi:CBS domain-containing protein
MAEPEEPCRAAGQVASMMTPRPVVAEPTTPIREVWRAMLERRFRHMPVVDDAGRVCGILSQRDLLLTSTGPEELARDETPAKERMQTAVDTVRAEGCVAEAARHMLRSKRSALPVVDVEGHLIGILTEADFARAVARGAPPCTCGGLQQAGHG